MCKHVSWQLPNPILPQNVQPNQCSPHRRETLLLHASAMTKVLSCKVFESWLQFRMCLSHVGPPEQSLTHTQLHSLTPSLPHTHTFIPPSLTHTHISDHIPSNYTLRNTQTHLLNFVKRSNIDKVGRKQTSALCLVDHRPAQCEETTPEQPSAFSPAPTQPHSWHC